MSVEFESHIGDVVEATEAATKRALVMCGLLAHGYAVEECPVDTGNLRNSIAFRVLDDEMQLGAGAGYAPYVEMGTGSANVPGGTTKPRWRYQDALGNWHWGYPQPPRPFIKPAIADHIDQYIHVLETELKK